MENTDKVDAIVFDLGKRTSLSNLFNVKMFYDCFSLKLTFSLFVQKIKNVSLSETLTPLYLQNSDS